MKSAEREAEEMLAVYKARVSYARDILRTFESRVAELDAETAKLNRIREGLQRDFDTAPEVIESYERKIVKQARVVRHIRLGIKVKATGGSAPRRAPSTLEKLQSLKRQMAKLQADLDGTTPDPEPTTGSSKRWMKIVHDTGLKFMRCRRTREWFYCDEGGGQVYGAFDTLHEAKKNASI